MSCAMTGLVLQKKGENAILKMQKHSACAGCGACSMADEKMNLNVEAFNDAGSEVGDIVEVQLNAPDLLKAAFIAYSIPLIALIVGVVGGIQLLQLMSYNGNIEVAGGAAGVFLMVVSYALIRMNEKKIKKSGKYSPVIVKVIQKNDHKDLKRIDK